MKTKVFVAALVCFALSGCSKAPKVEPTLKDALKDKFLIGTALNYDQFAGIDTPGVEVIKKQFSAVVPENCMKSEVIHPVEGQFDFTQADLFVAFGETYGMWITGHCLVWHSQTPPWLFVDGQGKEVSRDVLLERLKTHITTVVGRYKGRIKGWDVVNEAIMEDGSYRQSLLYKIIGQDFIDSAFVYAHAADPDAQLYYNDYSMAREGKRNTVVALVNHLKENGIRIDAVGMQGHCGMNHPDFAEEEKSIVAFAGTGVKVMITELDMSVLPKPYQGADVSLNIDYEASMNPYPDVLPSRIDSAWTERYAELFRIFLKHSDKISRVTLWGTSDANSWLNNWPVPGRTDYPLLFDRNYQPKPVVAKIIELAENESF
jgi:endo-1,4-beta-xylanase